MQCNHYRRLRHLRLCRSLLASSFVGRVRRGGAVAACPTTLDKAADKWVEDTFKKMTLDDKVGQLSSRPSTRRTSRATRTSSIALAAKVKQLQRRRLSRLRRHGARRRTCCSTPNYGTVILGQPLAAASLLNRLQALSALPLLNTADFEAGVGFRIAGATVFPRQMAVGAAGDEQLAFEAARITAIEARAIGVHVNFSPRRRRQQQPAQSRHQHALVRRGSRTRSAG